MTTRIRSAYAAAFALAAALVLVASAVSPGSAFAAVSAVYTASTNPTYENPATGAIEDAAGGSNVALAESMVTSIVYENALIERDTDGVMYASLRFKLADQISSISLEASEDGASYEPVEVVQMQTGTDSATSTATADYRIAIPSETATLRCSMDVIPMGRAVVYFITFGSLQEGDADGTFVVSVTPGEGTDDAAPAAAAASATASGDAGASGGTEDAEGEQVQSADDLTGASANEGVQEFDEEGREVTGGKQAEASLDGGTIATIVGVAVAVIAVAGVAVYAAYLRPKRARQASAAAAAAAAAAPDERASRA